MSLSQMAVVSQAPQSGFKLLRQAAHELRAPMTTVRMLVDLIQTAGPSSDTESYYSVLRSTLDRQRHLLDQVRTIGRLQSGQAQFSAKPIALGPIFDCLGETFRPICDIRQIRLVVDVDANLPKVAGDREHYRLVFANLLEEALKNTVESGEIRITTGQALVNGRKMVAVRVADQCPVDTEPDPDLALDPEDALLRALDTGEPGDHLGTFFVQRVVEGLGGRLAVHREPGQGYVVTLWLPAA